MQLKEKDHLFNVGINHRMLNLVIVLTNRSFEPICNTVDFQLIQTIIRDKYNVYFILSIDARAHALTLTP